MLKKASIELLENADYAGKAGGPILAVFSDGLESFSSKYIKICVTNLNYSHFQQQWSRVQVQDADVRVQLHVPHPRLPQLLHAGRQPQLGRRDQLLLLLTAGNDSLGSRAGNGGLGSTTMIVILLSRERMMNEIVRLRDVSKPAIKL